MKAIGTKVCMMLPTIESWSMLGPKDIVVVLPVDSMKWNRSKEYNRYGGLFIPKEKKVVYEKVTIPNSGFTISLPTDLETPHLHYYAKSYCDVHLVILKHPDLEKYPFIVATYVESRNLITMMTKSRNVLEGELSGNFCCIHINNTSGIWHTVFDVEDPEDAKMSEKKELGKLIMEGKGTTKWKVGYRYMTKNERSFIYLGDLTGGWLKPIYGAGFGENLPGDFDCAVEKTDQILPLVIDITNAYKEEIDLIESLKGGYVSVFLLTYLGWLIQNRKYYRSGLKTLKRTGHAGIEVEQVFEDDKNDLKGLITNFYTSRYPNITGKELLIARENLDETNRKAFDQEMRGVIQDYVKNYRGRSYSSPSIDLTTAKDPEKFITYLKANKPSYRYYGSSIYNVLEYLGEEEFKKLIPGCTF